MATSKNNDSTGKRYLSIKALQVKREKIKGEWRWTFWQVDSTLLSLYAFLISCQKVKAVQMRYLAMRRTSGEMMRKAYVCFAH